MKLHEEFKEYESLWDNQLLEWKDANGNPVGNKATSIQPSNNTTNTNNSSSLIDDDDVVYAWDIYLDPRDKGTFCSAEKYNGKWDGMVYETKREAINAGWHHLLELEDEGDLSNDPNVYVEPDDFIIDTFEIPLKDVPQSVLDWSGIDL